MQSSKEQEGEIRNPSSVINAKKEENNRMGKTRDLFKKIRDTKGTFHAKIGSIKDRNGMDLTEADNIKKRWQEYTEELYKKDLHDPDNHDGMITHFNMPANLENSAVATGLEKVSFHSSPKERQCQRMFKLLRNCIHLTC